MKTAVTVYARMVNPEPLNIEITRDALAAQIIQDLVEHRRWERELTLGASDEELSKALGTCGPSNPRLDIHCNVNPQLHLICTTKMGQELLRLEAPEIPWFPRGTHTPIQPQSAAGR